MAYTMDGDTYDVLYARYLKRSPRDLLEAASFKEGDFVLDICAGSNGIVTKEALEMGASKIVAVDLNKEVRSLEVNHSDRVEAYVMDIETFSRSKSFSSPQFDIAICRQGANYWFKDAIIKNLVNIIKKGGKFVFNTFGQKPSDKPYAREYYLQGKKYVELVVLVGNNIFHSQYCEGLKPHHTVFQWIEEDIFTEITEKYFSNVQKICDKKSHIYVCTV